VAIQANYKWYEFSRKRFGKLSMKVTHIIDSGGYYGAEVMLVHLCQAQQKAGLQVEVISIGTRGDYKKPFEEKLEEYGIPYLPWRMLALPDLRESFKILRHCREGATDVIHSHGYKGNILLGLIPKCWRKIPVITTVHGYTRHRGFSKMTVNQWLDRLCLSKLDTVVLVSQGMKSQVNIKKMENRLCIVHNGIPDVETTLESESENFLNRKIKILSIGRLSPEKNFHFLIKKAGALREIGIELQLTIFGEGPERKSLENLIKSLNLENCVFLPGYISNTRNEIRKADIYVNCSTTEGMPITLLEAMREGCEILASKISANREILERNGLSELLFSLEDDSFDEKIISLKKKNISLKNQLKSIFKEKYTSKIMEKKYYEIYKREILSRKK